MRKNNVRTEARKQRKQQAAKARRNRRTASRNVLVTAAVKRRLRAVEQIIKQQEKTIAALQDKLKLNAQVDALMTENQDLMNDLAAQETPA